MLVFPLLHTKRLKLRKITPDDVPLLVKYANNKKISDRIINLPHPYAEHNAVFRLSYVHQGFVQKSRFVFAIEHRLNQEFIGEISLHLNIEGRQAELGYWIGEPFWNNGFISEAVQVVLEFGFDKLDLESIFATCHLDNEASWKVLLKNGFKKKSENRAVAMYIISKHHTE